MVATEASVRGGPTPRPPEAGSATGTRTSAPEVEIGIVGASGAGAEIGVLGPLRVVYDGVEQAGRGGVHRMLLSVLAAESTPISVDELLDVLSHVRPERSWSRQRVYSAAARLRSELPGVVVGARGTYALDRSRCVVDVERFECLARDARSDLVGGDAPSAVARLREALALWRGTALEEWRTHPRAEALGTRLEEIRLGGIEDLARGLVAAGEWTEAVDLSRGLLKDHPEREHTWASLLMALDALGATDEVWRTFDEARRLLAEAGLEPGVELEQVMGRLSSPGLAAAAPASDAGATQASLPPLVRLVTEGPLVGRDRELATLRQLATAALDGGGARLVLLEGAAGVGKTRLAAEVGAQGFEMGASVWFEIGEDRLEAPHGPLTNFVRRLVDALEPAARKQALDGPLGHLLGSVDRGDPVDRDRFRWAMFDAVADLVVRSIPSGGVLVIDDLHNVPPDGVDMIRHLLVSRPECRLLLIATDRAGTGQVVRSDPNQDLRRLPMTTTLRLRELTADGAVELMAELSGSVLDAAEQRQRLMELTHGNPLLIAAVANDGELLEEIRSGSQHVPLGVASVAAQVAGLLGRLDDASAAVLEAAAVIGQRFDRRVLWSLDRAGVPFDAVAVNEALATGVRLGLIATDPAEPNEFRFVHDLARRGIYDTLGPTERAKLHWSVGTAVARLSTAENRTTVLAHHLLAAWPVCPTGEVVERLQAAALEAAHVLALTRADDLFALALDVAARDADGVVDEARCLLLLLAGVTKLELGRTHEAVALVRDAVDVAQRHGWRDEVGLALIGLAECCRVLVLPPGARELLHYTREVVPRSRGDLLYLLQQVDDDVAAAAEQQALALAGAQGDHAAAASTLGAIAFGHLGPAQVDAAEALRRLGRSAADPGLEGLGLLYRWSAQIGIGEVGFDSDVLVEIEGLAQSTGLVRFGWSWYLWRALVALHHAGDLDEAADYLERARTLGKRFHEGEPWLDARTARFHLSCNLVGASIAAVSDDAARFRLFQAEDLGSGLSVAHDFRSLRASMHARMGQEEEAAELCDSLVRDGFLDRPRSQDWLLQAINLSAAYARLGDATGAQALLPLLQRHRHCHVMLDVVWYAGSVERYVGLLHGACHEWDAAVTSLHAAVDRHDRAKAVTVNIQTYQQLAWALTHRDGDGDHAAAASWRDRAEALAASIGAKAAADDPWVAGD